MARIPRLYLKKFYIFASPDSNRKNALKFDWSAFLCTSAMGHSEFWQKVRGFMSTRIREGTYYALPEYLFAFFDLFVAPCFEIPDLEVLNYGSLNVEQ